MWLWLKSIPRYRLINYIFQPTFDQGHLGAAGLPLQLEDRRYHCKRALSGQDPDRNAASLTASRWIQG
jgi:hypothetical protein